MSEDHMAVEESSEIRSLEALICGSFSDSLFKLSSTSITFPAKKYFHFLYNFDQFKQPIDEIAESSQCVLEMIGGSAQVSGKSRSCAWDIDGDDAYDWLVKANDEVFERIDVSLGEYEIVLDSKNGKKKEIAASNIDVKKFAEHGKDKVSFHIPTIMKPQEQYNILVNNANVPFEHVWLQKSEDNLHFIHPLVS